LGLGNVPKGVKIPEENTKTFERKMQNLSFAQKIQKIRDLEKEKKGIFDKED
jgi:hypothetical protein